MDISLKLDFEMNTDNDHSAPRRLHHPHTDRLERILRAPSNPSLTSTATGSVRFTPNYLTLDPQPHEDERRSLTKAAVAQKGNLSDAIPLAQQSLPVYTDGESVNGTVFLKTLQRSSPLSHHGVRIEFLGVLAFPGGLHEPVTFASFTSTLAPPGILQPASVAAFSFTFKHVEMPHESYLGRHVQIRYFLRASVKRAFGETVVERDVWAETFAPSLPLDFDNGWQLEVGLEDQLHIHFDSECSRFALTDSIIGTISFAIVSALRIKSADLSLVRREIVGNRITDQEALVKAQVLDGPAQAGDVVKFKLPLANLRDLTPTLKDVEKSMHLCYFVNLIIYDDQGHRYFKQQEVELFRPLPVETAAPNSHVIALRDLL